MSVFDRIKEMELYRRLELAGIAFFVLVSLLLALYSATSYQEQSGPVASPSISAYAYSMPDDGWAPLTVYLSPYGSKSNNPGSQIVRYEWDLDGDGFYEMDATDTQGYISYTFVKHRRYEISMRVTDEHNNYNTATTVVEVRHPNSSSVDYWTVFDDSQVQRIDLIFTKENWSRMWELPTSRTEVESDAMVFGEPYERIGVSMKGNMSLEGSGDKKSWKLDFNAYIEGQEYKNLSMLLLHNNFGDPSMLREKLASDMLQFAGVPDGFVSFVEVWIDIKDDDSPASFWGIYSMVERPDKKFLANRFGRDNDTGNLYKADASGEQGAADFAYYGEDIQSYPKPRGHIAYRKKPDIDNIDYSDIINLCYVIDGVKYSTPDEWAAAVEEVLNVDGFLRYLAASFLFLNLDTYPYTGNNFYIYNNPGTGKFEWIAWDENSSWGLFAGSETFPLYGQSETLGPLQYAPLYINVFKVGRYRQDYRAYMDLLVRYWFNTNHIYSESKRWHDLIEPYLVQGGGDKSYYGRTAWWTPESFDSEWQRIVTITQKRSEFIKNALAQEE